MASALTQVTGSDALPREILSGIDSLDLTCKVPAPAALLADLDTLKAEAGGDPRRAVLLPIGDDHLRVMATGMGAWWPYRLEHRFGLLGVGESANRPAWRVSAPAEALHVQGASRVVSFWQSIIEALTGAPVMLMASRLDVHADFAGLDITEADRPGFVCRSGRATVETENGALETLYWGKGGEFTVRLYDKLAEVQASGKGGYLLDLYRQAGLRPDESVHRLEVQVRRAKLREMQVETAEHAIDRAGSVYLYAFDKWLRLTVPGSATRRERADLDPRWAIVQAANVAAGVQAAVRQTAGRNVPALDKITPMINGLMVSAGAALGETDPQTVLEYFDSLTAEYRQKNDRHFAAEVQARRLDFSTVA